LGACWIGECQQGHGCEGAGREGHRGGDAGGYRVMQHGGGADRGQQEYAGAGGGAAPFGYARLGGGFGGQHNQRRGAGDEYGQALTGVLHGAADVPEADALTV